MSIKQRDWFIHHRALSSYLVHVSKAVFILLSLVVLLTDLLWLCFILPMTYLWKSIKACFIRRIFVLQKAEMNDKKGKTRKKSG